MPKKAVQFTFHSLSRAAEYNIHTKELIAAWERATDYKLPKKLEVTKFMNYGLQVLSDVYYYDASTDILFTCKNKRGFMLVITIMRKKVANAAMEHSAAFKKIKKLDKKYPKLRAKIKHDAALYHKEQIKWHQDRLKDLR